MPFPPAPPALPRRLRLAQLSDLRRLAVVAAAGFFYSNVFQYERPKYRDYVKDTLASYRDMYAKDITDPNVIVLVCEDDLEVNEVKEVYAALAKVYPSWKEQFEMDSEDTMSVIVGVASLSLQAGSQHKGKFQPDDTEDIPPEPDLRDRDKSQIAGKKLEAALHDREQGYFAGRMVVDTIVVHPAYWRRGHATSLVGYFTKLAESERVGLGVSAATMGVLLFKHLGYKHAETVSISGYKRHPKPIKVWIGLNEATSTRSHPSTPNTIWLVLSAVLRILC